MQIARRADTADRNDDKTNYITTKVMHVCTWKERVYGCRYDMKIDDMNRYQWPAVLSGVVTRCHKPHRLGLDGHSVSLSSRNNKLQASNDALGSTAPWRTERRITESNDRDWRAIGRVVASTAAWEHRFKKAALSVSPCPSVRVCPSVPPIFSK